MHPPRLRQVDPGEDTETLERRGGSNLHAHGLTPTPDGIAVDASGNLFMANTHNYQAREIAAGSQMQTAIGSNLKVPFGIAVDYAGHAFVVDSGNNRIVQIAVGTP